MNVPIGLVCLSSITRGSTDPMVIKVAEYVIEAVIPVVREHYPHAILSSGYRSYHKQYLLWVAHRLNRRAPTAAKPGTSYHEFRPLGPGMTSWAIDLTIPGVAPIVWRDGLRKQLRAHGVKFRQAATERTWIHLDGNYGGGAEHNPGVGTKI